jgi:hypothetical protein
MKLIKHNEMLKIKDLEDNVSLVETMAVKSV